MKITRDGHRVHQLEYLCAHETGDYSDDKLYIVDAFCGFWRRIPQTKAKESPPPDMVRGFFMGSIVALVPASPDLHLELSQAGWMADRPWHNAFALPTEGCEVAPEPERPPESGPDLFSQSEPGETPPDPFAGSTDDVPQPFDDAAAEAANAEVAVSDL